MPQGHTGKSALLPGNLGPIHEAQKSGDLCIVVVVVEELLEDIHGAVKAGGRGVYQVLLSIRGVNALNSYPVPSHSKDCDVLRLGKHRPCKPHFMSQMVTSPSIAVAK